MIANGFQHHQTSYHPYLPNVLLPKFLIYNIREQNDKNVSTVLPFIATLVFYKYHTMVCSNKIVVPFDPPMAILFCNGSIQY